MLTINYGLASSGEIDVSLRGTDQRTAGSQYGWAEMQGHTHEHRTKCVSIGGQTCKDILKQRTNRLSMCRQNARLTHASFSLAQSWPTNARTHTARKPKCKRSVAHTRTLSHSHMDTRATHGHSPYAHARNSTEFHEILHTHTHTDLCRLTKKLKR